jgi:hypothetical protein
MVRDMRSEMVTPNELAAQGLISKVKQWEERKAGRLKCYRIGSKVLYSKRHIEDYLALCEQNASTRNEEGVQ